MVGQYAVAHGLAEHHEPKMKNKVYEAELFRLQAELVKLQEWIKSTGTRLVIIFQGRDAAGQGGAIKRITAHLNPRTARIVALPAPTEREKTQWYFQRYVPPSAGRWGDRPVRPLLVQTVRVWSG